MAAAWTGHVLALEGLRARLDDWRGGVLDTGAVRLTVPNRIEFSGSRSRVAATRDGYAAQHLD